MWNFKVILWKAFLLLLHCGLSYSCGSAEYEINGVCCPMCAPGTHVYWHCTEHASTVCIPCTQKSFIDHPSNLLRCIDCTMCLSDRLGLKTERECSPTSDTVCGPLHHHYCTKTEKNSCRFAQKHTICRPGQYIIHKGTKTADTQCGECPDEYFSEYGVNCTAWTTCNVDQLKTAEGTKTTDTVCEDIPKRNKSILIAPLSLAGVVVAALCGMYFTEARKNRLKTLVQETLGHQRKDSPL